MEYGLKEIENRYHIESFVIPRRLYLFIGESRWSIINN